MPPDLTKPSVNTDEAGVDDLNVGVASPDAAAERSADEAAGCMCHAEEWLVDNCSGGSRVVTDLVDVFQLAVNLPHGAPQLQIMVSSEEQVQDVRQSIIETPSAFQHTCFHLEHENKRVNDFIRLSEVEGFSPKSELTLVEDPYTEKDARVHVLRIRELVGAAADRTDTVHGACAGLSLYGSLTPQSSNEQASSSSSRGAQTNGALEPAHAMADFNPNAPISLSKFLPRESADLPKTIKALSLSAWNPPPYSYRQRGHLLYLLLTTIEGEQYHITSAVWGFFVNRSSNNKFDPLPRPPPRAAAAHSLLTLLRDLSPSFSSSFDRLQEINAQKDPLAAFQPPNAIPASPWFVPPQDSPAYAHRPDLTRTQESFLLFGVENAETLRDWNEEFQSTRELPRDTVPDRVFRERLTSKLFADYNEAAVRGAVLVARGEVPALNPTEGATAQIFLYNNVFVSFGADGAGTFASEGADEAARAATGKDVQGVRLVNQLDLDGLFTPGTVIVDYLGKRVIGQTIVPGIFKQRGPDEHQIDYGAVDGKDVVAKDDSFTPLFEKMSRAMKVKRHTVWDKNGKEYDLECSVETKGLLGTDGRKYVLDLYRITPLDISWIEKHWREPPVHPTAAVEDNTTSAEPGYPHRIAVLRPELIEAFYKIKLRDYIAAELEQRRTGKALAVNGATTQATEPNIAEAEARPDGETANGAPKTPGPDIERVDTSDFHFALNPDVFSGQRPQTAEQIEQWTKDEQDVRDACSFLVMEVMPQLMRDLGEGDVGFPMDGRSLTRLMHKRGINVRYLGAVYELATKAGSRLGALNDLVEREMISRAFKHIANGHLRSLPPLFAAPCVAHLLNCLLGDALNPNPVAAVDESLSAMYPEAELTYAAVTPQSLQKEVKRQVFARFRHHLDSSWHAKVAHLQLLREISLKLGLQLEARDYNFGRAAIHNGNTSDDANSDAAAPLINGHPHTNGKKRQQQRSTDGLGDVRRLNHTFIPEDIVNFVPLVKEASPRSTLAEETFEAVRISFAQEQKEIGQELLLETLSLHEQIYGILHPEVSRFYSQLSMFYYQLEEKALAVEIARKAVIVSERTLGLDSAETILAYLNLGLFEHATGNTKLALTYMRHALELWKLVYGWNHPDAITTANNIAVMLQQLRFYHDSRLWFETSLRINDPMFGKHSVHTATLLFQLAQAMALDHDSKGAVNRMRDAYNIFLNELGADDKNTKEAESWLEQLTQNAVSIAKHAKDLQTRKIRRVHLNPQVTRGTRPHLEAGQSQSEASIGSRADGSLSLDSRSIDELIQFIEGGTSAARASPKKRSRDAPKRRRGVGVSAAL